MKTTIPTLIFIFSTLLAYSKSNLSDVEVSQGMISKFANGAVFKKPKYGGGDIIAVPMWRFENSEIAKCVQAKKDTGQGGHNSQNYEDCYLDYAQRSANEACIKLLNSDQAISGFLTVSGRGFCKPGLDAVVSKITDRKESFYDPISKTFTSCKETKWKLNAVGFEELHCQIPTINQAGFEGQ